MSYLKWAPSNLSNWKILWKKTKMPKFGTKNALFGYFWATILKNYCLIWSQHPRNGLFAKFCEIMKMAKFVTRNTFLGYFWARTFKKLLLYLKSAPSNLSICKISRKKNNVLIWLQKYLIWVFWVRILKKYCHIWN